ncbi:hypothetical protein RJ641_007734 [Dillenia turbinata]|uniref:Protein DEFECTIVE IN MERISTEM SILENCING 3-like n=1 Tax=Dillenia turbinata TaxID=194707 RepID=A0AAN8V1Y5_9MAGN
MENLILNSARPPVHTRALSIQDPSELRPMNQNNSGAANDQMQNGGRRQAESLIGNSKKLQDDLKMLGLKIKQHEDNLQFLKSQKNNLDESILDMQVCLGKYHSPSASGTNNGDLSPIQGEGIVEQILRHEKSAAGILCQLKIRHGSQASHLQLTKDVLGIVATLGKTDDDNLGWLFSEYLGMEKMLAVVCRTYEGVKALEMPYAGQFIADDPERRLNLLKPQLANGDCPPGFLGFAVNMIHVDRINLYCVTANGHGLRETLFYHLFSRLQVYKTRADMLNALPLISHGAISLDGGLIRSDADFFLGERREDIDVRFTTCSGSSNLPLNYYETEEQLKEKRWQKERILEDMKREQALLDHAKFNYEIKKQEFVKFLAESSSFVNQHQMQTGR